MSIIMAWLPYIPYNLCIVTETVRTNIPRELSIHCCKSMSALCVCLSVCVYMSAFVQFVSFVNMHDLCVRELYDSR